MKSFFVKDWHFAFNTLFHQFSIILHLRSLNSNPHHGLLFPWCDIVSSCSAAFCLARLLQQIHELRAGGGTTISAGLQAAVQISGEEMPVGRHRRLLFLTDMDDMRPGQLDHMVATQSERGLFVSFVGIGMGFKAELAEQVSKHKGSNYFCITQEHELRKTIVDNFDWNFFPQPSMSRWRSKVIPCSCLLFMALRMTCETNLWKLNGCLTSIVSIQRNSNQQLQPFFFVFREQSVDCLCLPYSPSSASFPRECAASSVWIPSFQAASKATVRWMVGSFCWGSVAAAVAKCGWHFATRRGMMWLDAVDLKLVAKLANQIGWSRT